MTENAHAGNFFGKICLKAIRDIRAIRDSNMWSVIKGGMGDSIFWWWESGEGGKWYATEGQRSNFLEGPPSIPFLGGTSWSSHKENPEEGAWSAYCNDFEKGNSKYFLSKQQVYRL